VLIQFLDRSPERLWIRLHPALWPALVFGLGFLPVFLLGAAIGPSWLPPLLMGGLFLPLLLVFWHRSRYRTEIALDHGRGLALLRRRGQRWVIPLAAIRAVSVVTVGSGFRLQLEFDESQSAGIASPLPVFEPLQSQPRALERLAEEMRAFLAQQRPTEPPHTAP